MIHRFLKYFNPTVILFLFFIGSPSNLLAQVLQLDEGCYDKDTREFTKIWIDKDKNLTYETALQKFKNNQFHLLDSISVPSMFMRGAYIYWMALVVKNNNKTTFPLLLYNTRLSEDSTWHFNKVYPPTSKKISQYGEIEPYGIIPYPLRWAWIYPIDSSATDTILIKYYNYKPKYNFTPKASDARVFAAKNLSKQVQENWYFIVGFGALFSVLLIALSVWLYLREIAFFWYAAFCCSLLITSLWNFESEIPPLYFISNQTEWTYTKLYLHTLFPAVCHTLFLYSFFKDKLLFLKKLVHGFLYICALIALLETFFLITDQLHWSWVLYWWFRNAILLYGLAALYFIQKIPGKQSKWIVAGALGIYCFDILSNFSSQYTSMITLLGMLIDVFCFTVATASRFNQIQVEKYELILAHQTQEIERKIEMEKFRNDISQNLRNEIASDLHDDMGTALSSISFLGEMASTQLDKRSDTVKPILERIITQSREMVQTMRGVVWVINPQSDSAFDFFDKIRSFAEVVLHSRQIKLSFQLLNPIDSSLSLEIQRNLFLICKEAIVNIARHSGANEALIRIETESSSILIKIMDNGKGFDPNGQHNGNGLRNLHNRTRQIAGKLDLVSIQDEGTTLILLIPIA